MENVYSVAKRTSITNVNKMKSCNRANVLLQAVKMSAGRFCQMLLLPVVFFLSVQGVQAQCYPTQVYDKIVSGYHQSIALKADSSYVVWGEDIDSTGAGSLLTPVSLSDTNFNGMTGLPIKVAIGGTGAGSGDEQYIVLTTTHLWVWGPQGKVISSSLTSTTHFRKIISPTNADTTGLPPIGGPSHVSMMFATDQTLAIVTDSGFVYVLTEGSG